MTIVEDQRFMRTLFRAYALSIGFSKVYEADNGADGHEIIARHGGACVIDVNLGGNDCGIDLVNRLHGVQCSPILISGYWKPAIVIEAMRTGCKGICCKSDDVDGVIHAIRQVSKGLGYVSPRIGAMLADIVREHKDPTTPLTEREEYVLLHVYRHAETKAIASAQGVSDATIGRDLKSIAEKIGADPAGGLASMISTAHAKGLIKLAARRYR